MQKLDGKKPKTKFLFLNSYCCNECGSSDTVLLNYVYLTDAELYIRTMLCPDCDSTFTIQDSNMEDNENMENFYKIRKNVYEKFESTIEANVDNLNKIRKKLEILNEVIPQTGKTKGEIEEILVTLETYHSEIKDIYKKNFKI